jgi:aminoglycoside phosphotransferase (APT) family kinase protein
VPVWDAEVQIDAATVRALLAEQFPQLAAANLAPLAEGWDNAVWLVDDCWAFRFPRRAVAVPLLEREIGVLRHVAPRVPIPVPEPIFVGRPGAGYPWPFAGGPFLPGAELAESGLPDEGRRPLARAVATLLRRLHDPDVLASAPDDLPIDPNRRADARVRSERASERLDELERRGLWRRSSGHDELLAAAIALPPEPHGPMALTHGDLHARHLLVDEAGRPAGVIDWGDACIADPTVDLMIAYGAFRGAAREAFWETYGDASDDQRLRARVLALFLSATLLLYADDVGLAALAAESREGLARAIEP